MGSEIFIAFLKLFGYGIVARSIVKLAKAIKDASKKEEGDVPTTDFYIKPRIRR